ncbi:MAG TPA: FtsX-like permease family protein, partial [Candidatus Limnocylindrales bacterium]|nr:FtsX-like permease family protein [Candidatus Limnocylindrales bacterium]
LLGGEAGDPLGYEWRVVPSVGRLTVEGIEPVRSAAVGLSDRLRQTLPPGQSAQVVTDLPATLKEIAGSVLVSRSGIIVLILEFGVVAAYAIVLVAGLLGDRRRTETALLRSRGGSARSVIGMATLEATILAVGAALVAPLLSLGAIRLLAAFGALGELGAGADIGVTRGAFVADLVGAGIGIVAMTLPMLSGASELAGVRAAMSRPIGRTLGQRLGIDLALVVLAGIGLWQLRLYGAPLTRNVRGVLGVDPLLVAAPAIGLIAGALLATRAVPRLAEVAQPLLERGRGLVGSIGGRAVARRPLRYTRSALLLMLAAALGTFSVADVATWTRSQSDQAAYQAGADVRIIGSNSGSVDATALGPAYRRLPGVTEAMPVDRYSVDSGRSVRGATLLAVDSTVAARIVLPPADVDPGSLTALYPRLVAAASAVVNPLPAGARRVSLVLEPDLTADFLPDPSFQADLASDQGIQVSVVLEDASGRFYRTQAVDGFLAGHAQRLAADLPSGGRYGIQAIEVTVAPNGPFGVSGTIEITNVETSPATAGESWTTLNGFPAAGAAWTWPGQGDGPATFHPRSDHPLELRFGAEPGRIVPPSGFGGSIPVRLAWLPVVGAIPVVASRPFLTLTSADVGDQLPATIQGTPIQVAIVAAIDEFPTLDPAKPFLIADGGTVAIARFNAAGAVTDPGEWWLATSDSDATVAGVPLGPDPAANVIARLGLQRAFAGDPNALGVVGLLGLGSIAAMVFAAIGFVVSAAVSTSERAGELALLRALGLSTGEVAAWLSFEHVFLLVFGIGAGIGLGALLAWLV